MKWSLTLSRKLASERLSIVERFTPNEDGSRLNYVIKVTDSETFTEPVEMKGAWVWRPAEQVKPYNCRTSARS